MSILRKFSNYSNSTCYISMNTYFITTRRFIGSSSKVIKIRKTELPNSKYRVIKKTGYKNENSEHSKQKDTEKIPDNRIVSSCNKDELFDPEFRQNEIGVQMISDNLFQQLFEDQFSKPKIETIRKCRDTLKNHNLNIDDSPKIDDVKLSLPKIEGKDILEHFYNIGEKQSAPYRELIERIVTNEIPLMPKQWVMEPGWLKYNADGTTEKVPYPSQDVIVFDVEVCMKAGSDPTLACAVSPTNWYGWVSDALVEGRSQATNTMEGSLVNLIPLESTSNCHPYKLNDYMKKPKLVIGHNVSFDRARIREQYWIERTATRFLDTMSMHVCVSGVTSYQRAMLKTKEKEVDPEDLSWMQISSLNNLADVYKLYCGKEISKEPRNIFMEGTLLDVKDDFQNLMTYCAGDVLATLSVLKSIYPMFMERFPHPVTLAGMLELGTAYLPINASWRQYIHFANLAFEDIEHECKVLLSKKAVEACRLMHNNKYLKDLWMWDQDWSVQSLQCVKGTIIKKGLKKSKKNQTVTDDQTQDQTLTESNVESHENKVNNVTLENDIMNLDPKTPVFGSFDHEGNFKVIESEQLKTDYNVCNLEDFNDDDIEDPLNKKFSHLYNMPLPVRRPFMPGYPAWYRKLCVRMDKNSDNDDWAPGPFNISTAMQVTPKLLRLSWEGYPLHFIRGHGWGFLVPYTTERPSHEELDLNSDEDINHNVPFESLIEKCPVIEPKALAANTAQSEAKLATLWKDVESEISKRDYYSKAKKNGKVIDEYSGTGVWSGITLAGTCFFMRLPHKDGAAKNVGNPLSKDFLNKFSENVLIGEGKDAEKVLLAARMLSYWRNNRDRVMQQKAVWFEDKDVPSKMRGRDKQYGAILPQVVVCGTLTRRAMEPTWIVASNAHEERIGSELRAIVQSFPGYSFVGADVDSQELWIAAILGDSKFGIHGATPFGWMTLSGSKAAGTDMHSHTAKTTNITRSHAKVINYARIYGAGQNFAEQLLKQFNPAMSDRDAKLKAQKMFSSTKGRKYYRLKDKYIERVYGEDFMESSEQPLLMSAFQANQVAKQNGKKVDELFEQPTWIGGTESEMFNRLEEIAGSSEPRTPFLNCQLTRALLSDEELRKRHLPTAINWVVQSGAVDFLHLMLVNMCWLTGGKARFCLSFHDEVRYMVPEHLRYETALALHITNLYTRAFCAKRLGFNDLPMSVAFFSSVDVDTSLRKEAKLDCVTPSNPHGLEAGYGIPMGECLDIYQTIGKCPKGIDNIYQGDKAKRKREFQLKKTEKENEGGKKQV